VVAGKGSLGRDEWDVAMADGTIYRLVVGGVGQWLLGDRGLAG
jgi:hypothetical protein